MNLTAIATNDTQRKVCHEIKKPRIAGPIAAAIQMIISNVWNLLCP
jgi:hypothetical protein